MKKPHIAWSPKMLGWICAGGFVAAIGRTPRLAYDEWCRLTDWLRRG